MDSTNNLNTDWRKVAATIYRKPTDSRIFGSVEIDVTDLERYVSEKRRNGLKITLTHIMVLTVARALHFEVPELNTYVKRGNIIKHKSIDATVSVLLKGGQMGSVKIDNADKINLEDLVEQFKEKINTSRKGDENQTMQSKNILASIPWPFRNWIFRLFRMVTINWGLTLPFLKVSTDSFGSFLVTNIGTFGLDLGIPSLLPSSNVSFVLVMGGVHKKPAVVNDEIVPRRIMTLGAVLDHRVVDGSHGGKLFRFIKYMIKHPEELEERLD